MDKASITADVVHELIADQFPHWAHLPVRPVDIDGWDNTTFRVGEDLLARLPSADGYAGQVDTEQRWLPFLAPHLPVPIPVPVERGRPGRGFSRAWSVMRWLPGDRPVAGDADDPQLADDLAEFLRALRAVDATDGPPAGPRSGHRGADLTVYQGDVDRAIAALSAVVDAAAIGEVWSRARRTRWNRPPVWLHGDMAASNLLVVDGRLAGVIDFGQTAVGDPACDLVIAWTFFGKDAGSRFLAATELDPDTIDRARGWALWKALLAAAEAATGTTTEAALSHRWGWTRTPTAVIRHLTT